MKKYLVFRHIEDNNYITQVINIDYISSIAPLGNKECVIVMTNTDRFSINNMSVQDVLNQINQLNR